MNKLCILLMLLILTTSSAMPYATEEMAGCYAELADVYNMHISRGEYQEAVVVASNQLDLDRSDAESFLRLAIAVKLSGDCGKAQLMLKDELHLVGEGESNETVLKELATALVSDMVREDASCQRGFVPPL